jgi:hypothetical protein
MGEERGKSEPGKWLEWEREAASETPKKPRNPCWAEHQ